MKTRPINLPLLFAAVLTVSPLHPRAQTRESGVRISLAKDIPPTGIRALSVVDDSVVWAGGSDGYIGNTTDGGAHWHWAKIPGAAQLDFRSLVAFDARTALVANAGFPARIFRTTDGGARWQQVYTGRDSAVFLDGMVFRNKRDGIVCGDPVKRKRAGPGKDAARFLILRTRDGGRHWKKLSFKKRPPARAGEAAFAASNSALFQLRDTKKLWLGTGGAAAGVYYSGNFGKSWKYFATTMIRGKNSTGIFSVAFRDKKHGIAVGGDYTDGDLRLDNARLTGDGGRHWEKPIINPLGYRSSVIYLSPDTLLATGTTGTDLSVDGGSTWQQVSSLGFNVVQKAAHGNAVFLGGPGGRLGRLSFSTKYTRKAPGPSRPGE